MSKGRMPEMTSWTLSAVDADVTGGRPRAFRTGKAAGASLRATLASCLAFAATQGAAATLEPITIAEITRLDDLGFACIEEDDLEVAYSARGKKDGLLPRTCLPAPCVRMIDEDELAQQIGRDPTEEEWADYVARYAELCVAETTGAWPEDVMFANASAPVTNDTFWDGLAGVPLNEGVGSDVVAGLIDGPGVFTPAAAPAVRVAGVPGLPGIAAASGPRGGLNLPALPAFPGFIGGGGGGGGGGGEDGIDGQNGTNGANGADGANGTDGEDGRDGEDGATGEPGFPLTPDQPGTLPPPPVTPIPLPASFALLLGALGVTWAAKRGSVRRASAS